MQPGFSALRPASRGIRASTPAGWYGRPVADRLQHPSAKQPSPPRRRLSGFRHRPDCSSAAQPERRPAGVFFTPDQKKSGADPKRGRCRAPSPAAGWRRLRGQPFRARRRWAQSSSAGGFLRDRCRCLEGRLATAISGCSQARRSFLSALAPTSAGGSRPVLVRSASAFNSESCRHRQSFPHRGNLQRQPSRDARRRCARPRRRRPAPARSGRGLRASSMRWRMAGRSCTGAARAALLWRAAGTRPAQPAVLVSPRTITSGLLCHGGRFWG